MNKQFTDIKTNRLLLRRFVENDIEYVFKGLSHPQVVKYYGVSFRTLEETKEQMKWYEDLEKSGTGIWRAICSNDNKIFYGAGGFNDLKKEHRKAEVGFWLLPDFWGKGIVKEAMQPIIDYGFNRRGLRRIEGFVESENENCKRALRKMDFIYEGTLRDCEMKNGKFISLDIYAKINANRE